MLVVALSACTASSGGSTAGAVGAAQPATHAAAASTQAVLARALQAWSDFPVTQVPRPVVMVGPVVAGLASGFPSGQAKLAFEQDRIVVPSPMPTGPTTSAGVPLITAEAAFKELTAGPPATASVPSVPPLQVTAVRFGTASFATDRGRQDLPAWLFTFAGVTDPAAVLALAPPSVVLPPASTGYPGQSTIIMDAQLGANGKTLTLQFVGAKAGTGPCTADYTLDVASSPTAVAVYVVTHAHGGFGAAACAAVGISRTVTSTLPAPLGARVLVGTPDGLPIPVTTAP